MKYTAVLETYNPDSGVVIQVLVGRYNDEIHIKNEFKKVFNYEREESYWNMIANDLIITKDIDEMKLRRFLSNSMIISLKGDKCLTQLSFTFLKKCFK